MLVRTATVEKILKVVRQSEGTWWTTPSLAPPQTTINNRTSPSTAPPVQSSQSVVESNVTTGNKRQGGYTHLADYTRVSRADGAGSEG